MLILETDNSNNEIRINAHSEIYYQFLLQPSSTHSKFIGKRQKSRTCLQTIINFKTKTSAKCIIIGASGAFRKKKKKEKAAKACDGGAECVGRRSLLRGIWLWSPCWDEFGERGVFQFRRRVAARIRPWRERDCECVNCEGKGWFSAGRIPPLHARQRLNFDNAKMKFKTKIYKGRGTRGFFSPFWCNFEFDIFKMKLIFLPCLTYFWFVLNYIS